MHCFTGTTDEAQQVLEHGYYLGVGGVVTFKKSDALRETVRTLPLDRILLETDSPYLTPQKWRGKRNEPSYVTEVARVVAETRNMTLPDVAKATTDNALRFFKITQSEA
jgi:TatD DNase family protein